MNIYILFILPSLKHGMHLIWGNVVCEKIWWCLVQKWRNGFQIPTLLYLEKAYEPRSPFSLPSALTIMLKVFGDESLSISSNEDISFCKNKCSFKQGLEPKVAFFPCHPSSCFLVVYMEYLTLARGILFLEVELSTNVQ